MQMPQPVQSSTAICKREAPVGVAARVDRRRSESLRRAFEQRGIIGLGPDHAVRADDAALAALDAEIRFPDRHGERHIALLVLRRAAEVAPIRPGSR